MTKPSREEFRAINARAYAAINRTNAAAQVDRNVKLRAITALSAVRQVFNAADVTLARKGAVYRRNWLTRQKLIEAWLEQIAERGI